VSSMRSSRASIVVMSLFVFAAQARAEDAPTEPSAPSTADELEALKARQTALEERVARAEAKEREEAEEKKRAQKRAVTFSAAPGKGFGLTVGDGRFSINLKPRVQIRDTILAQSDK